MWLKGGRVRGVCVVGGVRVGKAVGARIGECFGMCTVLVSGVSPFIRVPAFCQVGLTTQFWENVVEVFCDEFGGAFP